MKRVLYKLDCLCNDLKMEYMVTGTAALAITGFPTYTKPQDIDILVTNMTDHQKEELLKQEFLSGLETKEYKDSQTCFGFYICGVKINVIESTYTRDYLLETSNPIVLKTDKERFCVNVQKTRHALEEKMKLGRAKDKDFLLDVISNLMDINNAKVVKCG